MIGTDAGGGMGAKMITAGIDCGAKNVRVVLLDDGEVVGRAELPAGADTADVAERAYDEALQRAALARGQVLRVVATGAGKRSPAFKDDAVTEVGANARGMHHLAPDVRTVIDVGAEEGRAIKVDGSGGVVDFAINDKCAAGAGTFTEAMARALEVSVEQLGELALQSNKTIPLHARCVVFAESEIVSLIHDNTDKPDMARAIHDAIADQVSALVRRVGLVDKVAVIGGVARNVGFVKSLAEDLKRELVIVDELVYVGAIGAALLATDESQLAGARV